VKTTEKEWGERVRAWRASGQDAATFAASLGYAASTLRWWSSRIGRAEPLRIVRLLPRPSVATASVAAPSLVLEVGGARVYVTPGFDAPLLADVVRALASGGTK
jgi:hypothetical protein